MTHYAVIYLSSTCAMPKKSRGFSICSFSEELQNYTQFICGFMGARVQNGVSGSYVHAVFKPAVQQGAEIWTEVHYILLPREAKITTARRLVEFL